MQTTAIKEKYDNYCWFQLHILQKLVEFISRNKKYDPFKLSHALKFQCACWSKIWAGLESCWAENVKARQVYFDSPYPRCLRGGFYNRLRAKQSFPRPSKWRVITKNNNWAIKKKKDMDMETFRDKNILRWFKMIHKQNVFLCFTLVGK